MPLELLLGVICIIGFFHKLFVGLVITRCIQLNNFNQIQVCHLLEVFLLLFIKVLTIDPHKYHSEVSACPDDQLNDMDSICHSNHSLGFLAVEIVCIVAV